MSAAARLTCFAGARQRDGAAVGARSASAAAGSGCGSARSSAMTFVVNRWPSEIRSTSTAIASTACSIRSRRSRVSESVLRVPRSACPCVAQWPCDREPDRDDCAHDEERHGDDDGAFRNLGPPGKRGNSSPWPSRAELRATRPASHARPAGLRAALAGLRVGFLLRLLRLALGLLTSRCAC